MNNSIIASHEVTPSRVCGLKHLQVPDLFDTRRHTLAGVWIEASKTSKRTECACGHTLAGVWIEATYGLLGV